jgi:hypothetical protein
VGGKGGHSVSEHRTLTVPAPGVKPPGVHDIAGAKANADAVAKAKEVRDKLLQQAKVAVPPAPPPEPPATPREDVETIEVELPNGLHVVFGPPQDVSLTVRIATQFPETAGNQALDSIVRVAMSIRSINGDPPPAIGNMVDVQKLANRIGDRGLDVLAYCQAVYWPPLTLGNLPAVKKNLRQS